MRKKNSSAPDGVTSEKPNSHLDKSPYVWQRDKLSQPLIIKELPWTEKQKQFIDIALDKKTKIMIVDGPAGVSKTLLSVYCSLVLLNEKKVSDLVYIRSTVQTEDGETGFLTGNLAEKTQYFNIPLFDKLEELLNTQSIKLLQKENRITTYPTSMLRGYNFAAKAILFDEVQNSAFNSLVTAATRIAAFSKLFLVGDSRMQNDYGKKSGFKKFIDIFRDQESKDAGIVYFQFDKNDIVRSEIVHFIVSKIEDYYENDKSMFPK